MSTGCLAGRQNNSRRSSNSSGLTKKSYCLPLVLLFSCLASVALLSILLTLYIYMVDRNPQSSFIVLKTWEACGRNDSSGPLLLTSMIKDGRIAEAQELSRVELLRGVQSYSGFLTVNQTFNANIFFWFFPSEASEVDLDDDESIEKSPLILYLQGGPGLSSLFGLFLENGPLELDAKEELQKRPNSWSKNNHLLYFDSPVGTGFSFANSTQSFATTQVEVVKDLYVALIQFFQLFPNFQRCHFYVAGTSYSGKTVPMIGYKIHIENEANIPPKLKVNLKGLLIGSGYFDGKIQDEYSDFYYQLGLLDKIQKETYREVELKMKSFLDNEEFAKAREELTKLVLVKFMNYTGFDDIFMYNALHPHTPPSVLNFESFLNTTCMKSLLHAGTRPFDLLSVGVYSKFSESDFYFSPKNELEKLLDANYRILIYSAQFDLIVTHTGQSKFLETLSWHGTKKFLDAPRKLWKVNHTLAGYTKEYDNLVSILIRNAGHTACSDQPLWCEDMVQTFTKRRGG